MADVEVNVSNTAIITALNTPGGAVFNWRDRVAIDLVNTVYAKSPVNNPLNAMHRGGRVGIFKRSWNWSRIGSNGHTVRAVIYNSARHAEFVEEGRGPAVGKWQTFSWRKWGGDIAEVRNTRGRPGHHILARTAPVVVARHT
jgi:hypothetical protein